MFALCLAFTLFASGNGFCLGKGEPLPDFELIEVESGLGRSLAAEVKGAVSAVVFMQTTCSVCKKELNALKEIAQTRPALKIVAISVDSGSAGKVAKFKKGNAFDFTFLHDPDFEKPALFGFGYTPGLVVVDRAGRIALIKGGFKPEDKDGLAALFDGLAN